MSNCKHLHAQIVEWEIQQEVDRKMRRALISYHPHGKRVATKMYCLECDTIIDIPHT